jgi:hypothetical protein
MADKVVCTLPSGQSACRLMQGDWNALPTVLLHMLGRSAIIGVGCYAAGFRGRDLVKASLAGATAIEAVVLLYTASQVRKAAAEADAAAGITEAGGLRRRLDSQRDRVVVAQLPGAPRAALCDHGVTCSC